MFLNTVCVGIFTGVFSDLSYFFKKILKNNFIINNVIDFCIYFIGIVVVFIVANKLNNNIFAFYEIFGFLLGVFLEKISCANLFAKFFNMLYNNCAKVVLKLKFTRFGKRVFK